MSSVSIDSICFSAFSLTWLSPSSLKSAEAKLANMVDLIGYPKLVLNTTWLDSIYSDVEVSDDDYLVNFVDFAMDGSFPLRRDIQPKRGTY